MLTYIPQIAGSVVVLFLTGAVRVGFNVLKTRYLKTHQNADHKVSHIFRVMNFVINAVALIAILIIWGVNPTNLFVALGSVFAVIGVAFFAQWSILSNVTAGVILFFAAPFRIGDTIRIVDKDMPIEATVIEIFTFYTHLRTKEGELHIFPNSLLLQKAIAVVEDDDLEKK